MSYKKLYRMASIKIKVFYNLRIKKVKKIRMNKVNNITIYSKYQC